MLTVIFAILTIVAIVCGICAYKHRNDRDEDACVIFAIITVICVIAAIIVAITCICYWCDLATEYAIDQKIEMYQEENDKIEKEIDLIVKEYMAHEKETFASVSPDSDTMVLVSLFPELKSDELVKQQMELHANNAAEIKSLKESKIDLAKKKWLLYFGR